MCKSNKRFRDGFSCGDHDLDLYLSNIAFQDQKRHLCKVFLGLSPDNKLICFYTLSCGGLNGKLIPGGNRKPYNAVAEGFYAHYGFQPPLQEHKQYVSLFKTTKDILQLLKTT